MIKEDWEKAKKIYENMIKQAEIDLEFSKKVLALIDEEISKYETND